MLGIDLGQVTKVHFTIMLMCGCVHHDSLKKQEGIMLIDYQDMMIKFGLFETSY